MINSSNLKPGEHLKTKGMIFNIQRYSVHDGPGIRTVIFLKGCPLRCAWCANPESQLGLPEVMVLANRCIGCGRCIAQCPEGAIASTVVGNVIDREKCTVCGACVEACYAESMQFMGHRMTVEEVLEEIADEEIFYEQSGGGVTISGGEPFFQPDFTLALLKALKEQYLNTAVETCGYAPLEKIKPCLPYLDLFLYDIKHMEAGVHKNITGVDNSLVLSNARKLAAAGSNIIIRVPLIPGFNDTEENLIRTAEFVKELGLSEMHLLPYHEFGKPKYGQLGKEHNLEVVPPSSDRMEELRQLLDGLGLNVKIGG